MERNYNYPTILWISHVPNHIQSDKKCKTHMQNFLHAYTQSVPLTALIFQITHNCSTALHGYLL